MQRRDFLLATGAVGAAALSGGPSQAQAEDSPSKSDKFKLRYAPHFGMFEAAAGKDLLDQLQYAADHGFTAWEDNGMKGKDKETQEKIAKKMESLGMTMGVFVAHGNFGLISFTGNDKEVRDRVVQEVKDSVEVAKRVNAKWMTVVCDRINPRLEMGYQTAYCVELLRRCTEVLEPHNLVMVLEPLNWWRDHPELFLTKIPQAYEICRAVDSPSCKILFDIYHQQIQEGNLIPNIDLAWSEIGYFQTGDNPGRKEPGTGEINYRNVFKHIHSKSTDFVLGMEHGNSRGGPEGCQAVIDAYRDADNF